MPIHPDEPEYIPHDTDYADDEDDMDETEAMKKIDEANAIRIVTKDLDFPPVDKVEDNDISDAVSKFLNRQAKKEE